MCAKREDNPALDLSVSKRYTGRAMRPSSRARVVLDRLIETRWRYYNLHPDSAEILAALVHIARAQNIVEVGTANGYSAIVLAESARVYGGHVTTIERDGALVEEARRNIAEAGLSDIITVVPGSAYKVLKQLPGPWDFVFLDATKQEYLGYLERLLPKLTAEAVLVADNLLSHADELQSFREFVGADPRFEATVVPVGTGLLIARFSQSSEGTSGAWVSAGARTDAGAGARVAQRSSPSGQLLAR